MEYDHANIRWVDRPEQIWVVGEEYELFTVEGGYVSEKAALDAANPDEVVHAVTLHRPSLAPIYGGPTLLEALWAEMDRLMEGLMTKADAEDGGDRFRAAELAWVLAIVTNAYDPSVDRIRAEAVARWNRSQIGCCEDPTCRCEPGECHCQGAETELDPDEQQHQFDAAGVNGYEL
jgi:hypothetical protein